AIAPRAWTRVLPLLASERDIPRHARNTLAARRARRRDLLPRSARESRDPRRAAGRNSSAHSETPRRARGRTPTRAREDARATRAHQVRWRDTIPPRDLASSPAH